VPRVKRAGAADAWVRDRSGQRSGELPVKADLFTARLTVDITPELRRRIKREAFEQDVTVAELLRALLLREYPDSEGASR